MKVEDQLFLIEVLVDKITIRGNVKDVPQKKQINILVGFGNIASLEIRSETPGEAQEGSARRNIDFNAGKSYLFPCPADTLIEALQKFPLEVSVMIKGRLDPELGQVDIPWLPDFVEMLEVVKESVGYVTPMAVRDTFQISKDKTIVGDLEIFIRLSCFGKSIQTQFQVQQKDGARQFLFKDSNVATTFQCQKFGPTGTSSDVLPVAALYGTTTGSKGKPLVLATMPNQLKTTGDNESVYELFDDSTLSIMSFAPVEFKAFESASAERMTDSAIVDDIQSLRDKPSERKAFDLFKLVEVRTLSKGSVELVNQIAARRESKTEDLLTSEKINKFLCRHKDCPAAYKFKEYGLGPLATGKGLGTIRGDVKIPCEYGLSQTYGVWDNYGPYGIFKRPKSPELPFVSKRSSTSTSTVCNKRHDNNKCKPLLRLTGGGNFTTSELEEDYLSLKYRYEEVADNWGAVLRLNGGGQLTLEDFKAPLSPLLECKVIMDQFDKILNEYKKALGPCGKPSCPYSPNLIAQSCQKSCDEDPTVDLISCIGVECPFLPNVGVLSRPTESPPCEDVISACAVPECPFSRKATNQTDFEFKYKQQKPACGSARCPYTKYKTGLAKEDDMLELQFLPPAMSGKCGHPKCPYPVQKELEPIHWDCPDPLPKGVCKNPNCPYLPPDLRALKILEPTNNKGPCGSPACAYALPAPCPNWSCPLKPFPCPYAANQDLGDDDDSCKDLDCPFGERATKKAKCVSPTCPFSSLKSKNVNSAPNNEDALDECDDPDCPFSTNNKQCSNPNCPYSTINSPPLSPSSKKEQEPEIPTCPYMPVCPHNMESCPYRETCGVPNCPYDIPPRPCYPVMCPYCPGMYIPAPCPERPAKTPAPTPAPAPAPAPCPCTDSGEAQEEEDDDKSEFVCDDRTDDFDNVPCKVGTCAAEGGNLVCDECPCGGESGQGDNNDGTDAEYTTDDRVEDFDNVPCGPKSCSSMGGKLACDGCLKGFRGDAGAGNTTVSEGRVGGGKGKKSGKNRKTQSEPKLGKSGARKYRRSKYVYSIGDNYPGVQVGHRECIIPNFNVPTRMGWLWNIHTPCLSLKPRRGWRPGAIGKSIAKRIKEHRAAKGYPMQELPDFGDNRRKRKHRRPGYGPYESSSDETVAPKATLQIKKREGCYWITMNPLKDPNTLEQNENPYMDCTPMQFKISKNKAKVKVKNEEEDGYKTCYCGDDTESEGSSSDSELDIEFTPPAGLIHPENLRKNKNVIHTDTQYDPGDCQEAKKEKKGKVEKKGKKNKKGEKGGKKGKKKNK